MADVYSQDNTSSSSELTGIFVGTDTVVFYKPTDTADSSSEWVTLSAIDIIFKESEDPLTEEQEDFLEGREEQRLERAERTVYYVIQPRGRLRNESFPPSRQIENRNPQYKSRPPPQSGFIFFLCPQGKHDAIRKT